MDNKDVVSILKEICRNLQEINYNLKYVIEENCFCSKCSCCVSKKIPSFTPIQFKPSKIDITDIPSSPY